MNADSLRKYDEDRILLPHRCNIIFHDEPCERRPIFIPPSLAEGVYVCRQHLSSKKISIKKWQHALVDYFRIHGELQEQNLEATEILGRPDARIRLPDGLVLRNVNLRRVKFHHLVLVDLHCVDCVLDFATFDSCVLRDAEFVVEKIQGAQFLDCDLKFARIGSRLEECLLDGVSLRGTNLAGAVFWKTHFHNCVVGENGLGATQILGGSLSNMVIGGADPFKDAIIEDGVELIDLTFDSAFRAEIEEKLDNLRHQGAIRDQGTRFKLLSQPQNAPRTRDEIRLEVNECIVGMDRALDHSEEKALGAIMLVFIASAIGYALSIPYWLLLLLLVPVAIVAIKGYHRVESVSHSEAG